MQSHCFRARGVRAVALLAVVAALFPSADAACVPQVEVGPNGEPEYVSSDVPDDRKRGLNVTQCGQLCLITAICKGFVSQTYGTSPEPACFLKSREFLTVLSDWQPTKDSNTHSTTYSVIQCQDDLGLSTSKYYNCWAQRTFGSFSQNNLYRAPPSAGPFPGDLDTCTAMCLQDGTCQGFRMQFDLTTLASACVLFDSPISDNASLWGQDDNTAAYDISACRAAFPLVPPPPPSPSAALTPPQAALVPPSQPSSKSPALLIGVVCGVVAAVVCALCCLAFIFIRRPKPEERVPEEKVPHGGVINSDYQPHQWHNEEHAWPKPNTIHSTDTLPSSFYQATMSQQLHQALFEPGSRLGPAQNARGPAPPLGVSVYVANLDNTSEVEERRAAEAAAARTGFCDVNAVLDFIRDFRGGAIDGGRYNLVGTQRMGGAQAVVAFVRPRYSDKVFAAKFYGDQATFEIERQVYEQLVRRQFIANDFVHDMVSHENDQLDGALSMPSFIVMKKGVSMSEWCHNSQSTSPPLMSLWMLGEIASQVEALHKLGYVHRDLKPGNIIFLQEDNSWRLIDYGCAVPNGTPCQPAFTLHFAAPEVIASMSGRDTTYVADFSADVWAVGVLAFEMFTGELLFPFGASSAVMRSMLTAEKRFPHEERPEVFEKLGKLRKMVQLMLSRDPSNRPPMAEVARKLNDIALGTAPTTTHYTMITRTTTAT